MSDNNFDKHIKDQMDGFQLDFDQSNWDMLNDRLDLEFGEDTTTSEDLSFDKEIANKLSSQQVPYNSSHWAKLLERLEIEDSVKNRLISLTILEVTAIILVLFAIWNWKGEEYFNNHKESHAAHIPVVAAASEASKTDFIESDVSSESLKNTEHNIATSQESIASTATDS